jgi:hypothetical protein
VLRSGELDLVVVRARELHDGRKIDVDGAAAVNVTARKNASAAAE